MNKEWFDSKYFEPYYRNRDQAEADKFADNILNFIKTQKGESALDVCCGNGRLSIALNTRGLKVVGLDYSKVQIDIAKKSETETLEFVLCNIENYSTVERFDYAFNFFSSFGYVDNLTNLKILQILYNYLNPKGKLILDYWNCSNKKFQSMLSEGKIVYKEKLIGKIKVKSQAYFEKGFYQKDISFFENGNVETFHEKIMPLTKNDFEVYFKKSNFEILNIFGNYDLKEFDVVNDERQIFIVQKKAG